MSRGSVNKVILIGNTGAEPDTRFMPNGNPVTNLRLATSESWKDKNSGEKQERTEWHRIVCFGFLAEIAEKYVKKGSKLYIEGTLRTNKWTGTDGQDRYTTEIIANELQMLDRRNDNQEGYHQGGRPDNHSNQQGGGQQHYPNQQNRQDNRSPQQNQGNTNQGRNNYASDHQPPPASQQVVDDFDDDIPF